MPYTTEQIQSVSDAFRNTFRGHMPDSIAIQISLDNLAEYERQNCPTICEYSGEIIEGEPFVVEQVITYWIPAPRELRYYSWRGQVRETRIVEHYYADEEAAYEDGCRKCDYCDEWRYKDDLGDDLYVGENWYCCYDCAHDAGWETCERCGEWVDEYDRVIIDAGDYHIYCDYDCAEGDGWVRCDHCDEWVDGDYTVRVGDETWCESCNDYHAAWCDGCDERYDEDDIEYDEERDEHLCPGCRGEGGHSHRPSRRGRGNTSCECCLHSYGWTPTLTFRHTVGEWNAYSPKPPLFMGIELETDGGSNRNEYVEKLAGIEGFGERFWMTEDSSLRNGVEITGHPMSLDYHDSILGIYEEIGKTAIEFGYRSHDGGRCGLHVHVNRSFFGRDKRLQDAAGYKLMRLLQRFEPAFTLFSRRTDNYWCSYKLGNRDYKMDGDEVKVSRSGKDESSVFHKAGSMVWNETAHAQCLNFQHASTFEFRIFRGTLKWSTFFACLGMVDGLCRTVKKHGSIWVESVKWFDLMDEVIANCCNEKVRQDLIAYLDEKELRRS